MVLIGFTKSWHWCSYVFYYFLWYWNFGLEWGWCCNIFFFLICWTLFSNFCFAETVYISLLHTIWHIFRHFIWHLQIVSTTCSQNRPFFPFTQHKATVPVLPGQAGWYHGGPQRYKNEDGHNGKMRNGGSMLSKWKKWSIFYIISNMCIWFMYLCTFCWFFVISPNEAIFLIFIVTM